MLPAAQTQPPGPTAVKARVPYSSCSHLPMLLGMRSHAETAAGLHTASFMGECEGSAERCRARRCVQGGEGGE